MAKSGSGTKSVIAPIEEEVLSSSSSGDLITISSKDRTKADFPKKDDPKFVAPGTGDGGRSAGPGDFSGPGLGAGQGKKSFGDISSYDTIVVGRDASGNSLYWGDVDKDGKYDPRVDIELTLDGNGFLSDSSGSIDYTAKNFTVIFQAINVAAVEGLPRPQADPVLDLAGFGADDKLIVDFTVLRRMGIQVIGPAPNSSIFNASTFLSGLATKASKTTTVNGKVRAFTDYQIRTNVNNNLDSRALVQIILENGLLVLDDALFLGDALASAGFKNGRTSFYSTTIAKNISLDALYEFILPTFS